MEHVILNEVSGEWWRTRERTRGGVMCVRISVCTVHSEMQRQSKEDHRDRRATGVSRRGLEKRNRALHVQAGAVYVRRHFGILIYEHAITRARAESSRARDHTRSR